MESAVSFVLGALAGGALGATEPPVNNVLTQIISGPQLKPVISGIRSAGALGLGALVGTTALITAMTAAVMGVIAAAAVALYFRRVRKTKGWPLVGLTAVLATTTSGSALGGVIEKLSMSYGMVSVLWALGIFTVLKLLMNICVKSCTEFSGILGTGVSKNEQARSEVVLWQRVVLEVEQVCQNEKSESVEAWEAPRRKRDEINRQQKNGDKLEMQVTTSRLHLINTVVKSVEFLAFSGIPMTLTAFVTTGFGIVGFGGHWFVFVVLLVLVLAMSFWLMRSRWLKFWMFMGCIGMFATFAITVLTVHAGQEAAEMLQMRRMGQDINEENIIVHMMHASSIQAISAGFFVSEVCQVALGATAGGLMARRAGERVIMGASMAVLVILWMVDVWSLVLGVGGTAGALLGAGGAAGAAMGGAAAVAVKSSSWGRTLATTAGMTCGFLIFGKWSIANIGLKVCVAYIFAITDLY